VVVAPPAESAPNAYTRFLTKITEGKGTEEDIDKLEKLAKIIKDTSLCGLGQTAPNPILSTIKYFRDEYLAHVVDKTLSS